DRNARPGGDTVDLHRVRADVLAYRCCEVPVRTARDGGRVCDARLVSAVAHARAHDGALSIARPRARMRAGFRKTAAQSAGPVPAPLRTPFRGLAYSLWRRAGVVPAAPCGALVGSTWVLRRVGARDRPRPRPELLPVRR